MAGPLTHLNEKGEARMVDVGGKQATRRRAVACAELHATPEIAAAILDDGLAKGDAVAAARIAGIMAGKKTAELIPLCHPLPITGMRIDIGAGETPAIIAITAEVETTAPTGVEMEALTAASVAALTLYDMAKALDKAMVIANLRLIEKCGGKSGDFRRDA